MSSHLAAGDHGYQNGEKGEWCKSNNFELATRIPMVVSVPQSWGGWRRGNVEPTVVEALDLFPSLADLAGIAPPKQARATHNPRRGFPPTHPTPHPTPAAQHALLRLHRSAHVAPPYPQALGGESLRSLLHGDGSGRKKDWALTQWPRRPSCTTRHGCPDGAGNPYEPSPDQALMGYKLRTARWAYIAWVGFDWGEGSDPHGDATRPLWEQISARELCASSEIRTRNLLLARAAC